jgi:hypothetical protein
MNADELKKEAEDWLNKWELCNKCENKVDCISNFSYCKKVVLQSYLASAEPREKRIEELEKENLYYKDIVETNTAEWEEQGQRVVALEKENAELKDYRLTTLAKQQTEMSEYALNLEHKLSWYDNQLTKAKEIIEQLLLLPYANNEEVYADVTSYLDEAEQFLKEVEK